MMRLILQVRLLICYRHLRDSGRPVEGILVSTARTYMSLGSRRKVWRMQSLVGVASNGADGLVCDGFSILMVIRESSLWLR